MSIAARTPRQFAAVGVAASAAGGDAAGMEAVAEVALAVREGMVAALSPQFVSVLTRDRVGAPSYNDRFCNPTACAA